MQRRSFVKILIASGLAPVVPGISLAKPNQLISMPANKGIVMGNLNLSNNYLQKMRSPNELHLGDVTSNVAEQLMVRQLAKRLDVVKKFVGYANFSVLSFDKMLHYAKRYSQLGKFENIETDFLEKLFYEDANSYGFFGEKPVTSLTQTVKRRSIEKIPGTGQYLFKGKPKTLYNHIKKDIGENIILTSGVRNVVKQMHLFLKKAAKYEGNLSIASRSLAPPGYSFHGIGDFDVGHKALGAANFTEAFAKTDEFKKLIDLGYIKIRYPLDNELGVRFEPWHVKVS